MPVPVPTQSTVEALRDAALQLLPPGRAFSRRLSSMIAKVLEALSLELARVHDEARILHVNIFPRRVNREDYLDAWEEAAGITGASGTIAERAQKVALRLLGRRAFNLAEYQSIASEYGYTLPGALKVEADFFRASASRAEQPVPGQEWKFYFIGEVLGADNAAQLALLEAAWASRVKRAHTIVRPRVGGERSYFLFGLDRVVIGADRVVL